MDPDEISHYVRFKESLVYKWLILHPRDDFTFKFCIDSSKRSCRFDLHVVIAMGYTALYQITASFRQAKNKSLVSCGLDGRYFGNEKI